MSEIKICANKAPYKVEPSHSLENFAEARKLESLLAKEAYLKIEIDRLEKELEDLTLYSEKIGLAFQIKDDILSEEGNELITGKPVGNDKEKNKCTYVTKFGLQEAKNILEKITKQAVEIVEQYGKNGEFLKQLAIYIKERNK